MRNLLEAYLPPETATRRNPFREWIGARLRVDAYGWAAAGDPVAAARMAWEDARLSHTANGVYAAMFMAAAHAASLTETSSAACADVGLSVVPAASRLARGAPRRRASSPAQLEWEAVVDELYEARHGGYHWVHAINNTALVGGRALRVRRRLLRRRSAPPCRAAGTPTRTAPRSARSSARSPAPAGSRSAGRRRCTAASRARCRASTAITIDELARRTLARRRRAPVARSDASPLEQPRDPLVAAADRPADAPCRSTGAARRARRREDPRRARTTRPTGRPGARRCARWRDEARARIALRRQRVRRARVRLDAALLRGRARLALGRAALRPRGAAASRPSGFCAEAEREFGGFDGIVLWHAYPVIGIDERNQFDFYRDVPGLARARRRPPRRAASASSSTTTRGTSARGASRSPTTTAIAALVRELGADGVFLDTMKEARPELRAPSTRLGPGVAFEGESTLPLERICDHHLSWAQWFADSRVPGVLRARWFEQRHMLHHTRRWNRDHAEELHSAWLNGVGVLVWENVFGAWVGWNERDKALLRAMLPRPAALRRAARDAASGRRSRRTRGGVPPTVVALALDGRRDDALGASRTAATSRSPAARRAGRRRSSVPARRDRGVRRRRAGDGRAGGDERDASRRARPVRVPRAGRARARASRPASSRRRRRRRRSRRSSAAARPAPTARRRTSRSGSRCRRGCTTSSRSSATPSRRRASRSRVREVTNAELGAAAPAAPTGLDARRGARVRRGGRRAAADRGRVAARGRGGPARARASRSSGTGRRASTPTAARASRSSRAAPPGRPRARTGTSTAASRSRRTRSSCCSPAAGSQRSSRIGFRLAVDLP